MACSSIVQNVELLFRPMPVHGRTHFGLLTQYVGTYCDSRTGGKGEEEEERKRREREQTMEEGRRRQRRRGG